LTPASEKKSNAGRKPIDVIVISSDDVNRHPIGPL